MNTEKYLIVIIIIIIIITIITIIITIIIIIIIIITYHYLTISHRRPWEYRRIVTETKSRWLLRYSQSLGWLIVLV